MSSQALSGQHRFDADCYASMRDLLMSRTWMIGRRLIIDASELSYIDSWAAQVLVVTAKTLRDRGGGLVLPNPQPSVARTARSVCRHSAWATAGSRSSASATVTVSGCEASCEAHGLTRPYG
jgi:anti-anti-sigma factor